MKKVEHLEILERNLHSILEHTDALVYDSYEALKEKSL